MTRPFILRVMLFCSLLFTFPIGVFSQTLVERLGYPPDTKLIIVHADDLGETHSVNAAAIKALEGRTIKSASLMVPCPWFPEIADYAKSHPDADFGLHLTLTSERIYYRWGPVAPAEKVPSLVDQNGYFHHDWEENKHINARRSRSNSRPDRARSCDGRSSHAPRFTPVPADHQRQGTVRRYAAGGSRVQVADFRRSEIGSRTIHICRRASIRATSCWTIR